MDDKLTFTMPMEIVHKVTETQDRFIFETISNWLKDTYKIEISKEILCRALDLYKIEHTEEYAYLRRKMENEEREECMSIEERIKKLEHEEFMIQMNDHLSSSDYDRLREIHEELKELKKGDEKA